MHDADLALVYSAGLLLTSPAGWLPRTGISSGTLRSVIEYGLPLSFTLSRSHLCTQIYRVWLLTWDQLLKTIWLCLLICMEIVVQWSFVPSTIFWFICQVLSWNVAISWHESWKILSLNNHLILSVILQIFAIHWHTDTSNEHCVHCYLMHTVAVLDSSHTRRWILSAVWNVMLIGLVLWYMTCYFNVRSKADMSQLNLPNGTDN